MASPRSNAPTILCSTATISPINALEKLNCAYCSYANGVVAFTREIAARTEQYWCPIKHARRLIGAHARYALFDDYGNGEGYQERLATLRQALAKDE